MSSLSNIFEKSCAFVVLNEFDSFTYLCKDCLKDFENASDLETHIRLGHDDIKAETCDLYVRDGIEQETYLGERKESTEDQRPIFQKAIITNDFSNCCEERQDHLIKHEYDDGNFGSVDSQYLQNSPLDSQYYDGNSDQEIPTTTLAKTRKHELIEKLKYSGMFETIESVKSLKSEKLSKTTKSAKVGKSSKIRNSSESEKLSKSSKPKKYKSRKSKEIKNFGELFTKFHCEMCPDSVFYNKPNLRHHMMRHKKNVYLNKRCPICKAKPRNYEKHMRIFHTEEKPYKCDFCDATYRTNDNRLVHMRSHTKERPYLCADCGKSFQSMSGRYKHQLIVHTKVKRHQCNECDRSFYTPSLLKDHHNSFHSTERPHQCTICGKTYATTKYLNKHKKTHGDKLNKCQFCDKKFKLSENRRKHEKQVIFIMINFMQCMIMKR